MSEPKRSWFALPVPIGLLITFITVFIRGQVQSPAGSGGDICMTMGILAVFGGMTFPLGLFAPFVWSANVFQMYGGEMVLAGWIWYAALTIYGFVIPNRIVFWILCVLLVVNIGGCHLPQVAGSFKSDSVQ